MIKNILCPVHREGWGFVAIFGIVTFLLFKISTNAGWIGLLLTAWCAYFFRDPVRFTPTRDGLVVSPADGLIQTISMAPPPPELNYGNNLLTKISVFMNVFDVHINRAPMPGVIKEVKYIPGKFLNASLDKASVDNERQIFVLTLADGKELIVVQIAGLVARRILRWVNAGDSVRVGQRIGMIRFGSRVDVYLPQGVNALVIPGQYVYAGESVLADFKSSEPARTGTAQ